MYPLYKIFVEGNDAEPKYVMKIFRDTFLYKIETTYITELREDDKYWSSIICYYPAFEEDFASERNEGTLQKLKAISKSK